MSTPPPAFSRPFGVILLGILNAVGAVLFVAVGALLFVFGMLDSDHGEGRMVIAAVAGLLMVVGAFHGVTAAGLFLLKGFGRICQMIQSAIGLLAIPFGTVISALVLYYLTRPGVALLFSGRAPEAMTPEERALVARDSNQGVAIAIGAIIAVFGGVALIGIVAAIAIPGLLRARMAGNEATAIGSLRAMSSAQAAFASTHDGRYGTLACLTEPSSCPGADGSSGPFLNRSAAEPGPRSGYTYRLGLSADQARFVYWAEPADPAQGQRAFCITEAATVLEYRDYHDRGPQPPSDPDEGCPSGGRTL